MSNPIRKKKTEMILATKKTMLWTNNQWVASRTSKFFVFEVGPCDEEKGCYIEVRKYSKILNLDPRKKFVIPKCLYTKSTLNRGLIYKDKEQISPCTRKTYTIVECTLYQGVFISRFHCITYFIVKWRPSWIWLGLGCCGVLVFCRQLCIYVLRTLRIFELDSITGFFFL